MNLRIAVWTVSLTLAITHSFAREPQAPPSPSSDAAGRARTPGVGTDGGSLFVGHFGETIQLPYGWAAEAEMNGEAEAVFFHSKFQDLSEYKPFQPKKSDYKPENFTPMGLMELIVIPKNAPGGLPSLKALRDAKEQELKQTGAVFKILEKTPSYEWPRGTFHVSVEHPHRLWQTYSESAGEFYILTVGGSIEVGDFGLDEHRIQDFHDAEQKVKRSLSDHLLLIHKKTAGEYLFHFPEEVSDDLLWLFRDYFTNPRNPLSPQVVAAAGGFMLILALWPGRNAKARRARLFGRSLLFFPIFTGLAGFLIIYLPARFAGASWKSTEFPLLIPMLPLPWVAWAVARALGSARARRVLVSFGSLAALWAFLVLWGADFHDLDSPDILILENTVFLLIIGLTFGIAFAFSFGPLPKQEVSR